MPPNKLLFLSSFFRPLSPLFFFRSNAWERRSCNCGKKKAAAGRERRKKEEEEEEKIVSPFSPPPERVVNINGLRPNVGLGRLKRESGGEREGASLPLRSALGNNTTDYYTASGGLGRSSIQ